MSILIFMSMQKSSDYMKPAGESPFNLMLMELIDKQYMETPFYFSFR